MGGTFNRYLDPYLDRLSSVTVASIQALNDLAKSANLVDTWRLQHPTDKDYSFFSSLMHINHTWGSTTFSVDAKLMPNIQHTKYNNILISDHCPVSLQLKLDPPKRTHCCRFSPWFLTDQAFRNSTCLDESLETNETLKVSREATLFLLKLQRRGKQRPRLVEIKKGTSIPWTGPTGSHYLKRITKEKDWEFKIQIESNSRWDH